MEYVSALHGVCDECGSLLYRLLLLFHYIVEKSNYGLIVLLYSFFHVFSFFLELFTIRKY